MKGTTYNPIYVERTVSGNWRVTSDDHRLHVVGPTVPDALRSAASMIENLDALTGAAESKK